MTLRKAIHDLAQQRQAFLLHLHADRNVLRRRMLPERIGLRIDEPGGLIRQRRAGGEQAHAGAAAAEPVIECLHRVGRHDVDGIDAGEARRHGSDGIRHIAVVVAVGGGGMHDRRLVDAGVVHGLEQGLIGGRPLARPGGLRAAKRGQRITFGIRRDDVRMDIDDGHVGSLVFGLQKTFKDRYRRTPDRVAGVTVSAPAAGYR